MGSVAFIFPGQGSQYVGMGKQLYENSAVAREVFEQATDILGFDIKRLMFDGPQDELQQTRNCQPAIFIHSVACLKILQALPRFTRLDVKFTAGLSLGEYTALVASGVCSFKEGLSLVKKRALLMEEASKANPGAMAAVLGLSREEVEKICQATGAEIANLNCPGQIVISGTADSVKKAQDMALAQGAKNVVVLGVSIASHSSLMRPIADDFKRELNLADFHPAEIPVISNVTAKEQIIPREIRNNLTEQLYSPVRWEDSVRYMAAEGVSTFFEIGPNKVLKGLLRRIDSSLKVVNIEKPKDFEDLPL
jgi:[acyl-carrier-protein] S-malonyltransferase